MPFGSIEREWRKPIVASKIYGYWYHITNLKILILARLKSCLIF
jgi:hypothetical protein